MQTREKFSLTQRQKEIFDFILEQSQATGVTPTHNQIAAHLNISQPSVAKHLMAIERRGWIRRANGLKNGLSIVD
jgi:SOS-response transcriptional repressor LexA